MTFTPESLREAEFGRTLACLQFETEEYLFDDEMRRSVLKVLSKRGNACAFVGALDASMRCGDAARVGNGVAELCRDANEVGVAVGGVVGGDSDNVLKHMRMGMRLVAPPVFASDFALHGAVSAAAPFHEALASFNSS